MKSNRSIRSATRSLSLALALAAGLAAPVLADGRPAREPASTGGVVVAPSAGGYTIGVAGTPLSYVSSEPVVGARAIPVAGTTIIAVLWQQRDAGGTLRPYVGLSLDGKTFALASPTDYTIQLRYGAFDPMKQPAPAVPESLKSADSRMHLVQFHFTPLQQVQEQVAAAGGIIRHFMAGHTLVVEMDAAAKAKVAALPYVRWVGAYEAGYKLDERILADLGATAAPDAVEQTRYSIECFEPGAAQQQRVADRVKAAGGAINLIQADGRRMEATISPAMIPALAKMDEVNYIDPWGPPGNDMDIARGPAGCDHLFLDPLGFKGQGVRAEDMDGGLLTTHVAFQQPPPLLHGSVGVDSHGTSTYGIVFGNGAGTLPPGITDGRGGLHMREQGIIASYLPFSSGASRLAHTKELVDPAGPYRGVFQTNSWGNPLTTAYTTVSADMDDLLFQTNILICNSQSNAGSQQSRPEAWAKNIISVGGVVHNNNTNRGDDVVSGASFGPAADGRNKPDVCHYYENVMCTSSASTTSYQTGFNGTSAATPITASAMGLFFQMWHQGVWAGFGGAPTVFESRPPFTTAKAMAINTTYVYPLGTAPGQLPRVRQGWGMVLLSRMYNYRNNSFIVNESDVLTVGQTKSYNITVTAGEPELKITMTFSDPRGNPGAAQARINNLDLKVTAPGGAFYWGNNGLSASNFSSIGGTPNTVDTVENVFLSSPAAGTYKVEVIATEIVQDARPETVGVMDIDYALVVTGGKNAAPPPVCFADCSGDGKLDIADFTCFQNQFALGTMSKADCNTDGKLDIADFTCFQNKFALGCP